MSGPQSPAMWYAKSLISLAAMSRNVDFPQCPAKSRKAQHLQGLIVPQCPAAKCHPYGGSPTLRVRLSPPRVLGSRKLKDRREKRSHRGLVQRCLSQELAT